MKARTLLFVLLVVVFAAISFTAVAQDVAREDTVVFDIDGPAGAVANYDQMNYLLPDNRRPYGLHQAVMEPLFILNYETGEIMPWLAESMSSNDSLDVWMLNLREGTEWADGEAFDAEDVVWTINLLLNDETSSLSYAGNVQTWIESVEMIDAQTVQFNLTQPNPRFQLDFFSVRIWGGISVLPEHVWNSEDVDPFTWKYFDIEKGYPLGTGPYVLTAANETTWTYDRNDDWWGAKTGVFNLPEPKRAIWVVTGNDQIRTTMAVANEIDSIMDVTLGAFEAMQAAERQHLRLGRRHALRMARSLPAPAVLPDAARTMGQRRYALGHQSRHQTAKRSSEIAYEGVTIPSRTLYVEYGGMFPFIDAIEDAGMAFSTTSLTWTLLQHLLEKNGYSRNDDDRWVDGDGNALSLEIQVHEGFIEKRRITAEPGRATASASASMPTLASSLERPGATTSASATTNQPPTGMLAAPSTSPGRRWIASLPAGGSRWANVPPAATTSVGTAPTTKLTAKSLALSVHCLWVIPMSLTWW